MFAERWSKRKLKWRKQVAASGRALNNNRAAASVSLGCVLTAMALSLVTPTVPAATTLLAVSPRLSQPDITEPDTAAAPIAPARIIGASDSANNGAAQADGALPCDRQTWPYIQARCLNRVATTEPAKTEPAKRQTVESGSAATSGRTVPAESGGAESATLSPLTPTPAFPHPAVADDQASASANASADVAVTQARPHVLDPDDRSYRRRSVAASDGSSAAYSRSEDDYSSAESNSSVEYDNAVDEPPPPRPHRRLRHHHRGPFDFFGIRF